MKERLTCDFFHAFCMLIDEENVFWSRNAVVVVVTPCSSDTVSLLAQSNSDLQ